MASRREAPPLPTDATTEHKRHGPADHRESHQTLHRHQRPPRRPRGRSPARGRARHRPVRGRQSTKCSDGSKAASELARGWPGGRFRRRAAPELSPRSQVRRWRSAPVGTEHHDCPVRGSLTCRAINGRNPASGHGQPLPPPAAAVSPARAAAPAQDPRSGLTRRRRWRSPAPLPMPGCNATNSPEPASLAAPGIPAERLMRAHRHRVRTNVVTERSEYPTTYWYERSFRAGQLGMMVASDRRRSRQWRTSASTCLPLRPFARRPR